MIPWTKVDCNLWWLFSESASAIKGVIAEEKPIPIAIPIKTKLFPSETAARLVGSSLPTIILSTRLTKVWPSIPSITGKDNFKL